MRGIFRLAALIYMGLIFYLSSRPEVGVSLPGPSDKLAHLAAYALLGFLFSRAIGRPGRGWTIAVWALASLYGVSDELHQSLVPGRFASAGDAAADALGAAIGVLAGSWFLQPRQPHRHQIKKG